ncbi:NADP-dependent oxidoreductase [Vibrio aquimaris]|uniref:NADPH-dependent curcumin reductase n=1 Tax=Vibrio aquimaris TaxID=2587862 RepID=A0A5P9CQZ4_9VIBR|nr:NADP-dependent oxidoreductase [Vibrio aquimaris]QFT28626.1 NADPH-dependent curcumin reductase [Vibrio aquimaris]
MNKLVNPAIVLDSYPQGAIATDNFRLSNNPLGELQEGEFLVENLWLSLDPYTRPRLNKTTAYVEPIGLGNVIQGETIGKVVESKSSEYLVGDLVGTFSGWQKYYIAHEDELMVNRLPDTHLSPTLFLGVSGTPGRAAYFGLFKIGKPKAGETMVVSAASGAVGSVAGQIGKMLGCRVVGIAGSEEKCRYVVDELGFDECVNYKDDNFSDAIAKACPDGVDVYFENVGGRTSSIVARHLNEGSRVPICGSAALYNKGKDVDSNTLSRFYSSLPTAPENRFFLVTEWMNDAASAVRWLTDAAEAGQIKFRETITDGLENTPQAFVDLLEGNHFGKPLVRI